MSESRWLAEASDPGQRVLRRALDEATPHVPSEARRRRVWAAMALRPPSFSRRPRWVAGAIAISALAMAAIAIGVMRVDRSSTIAMPARPGLLDTAAGETLARTLAGGTEVELGGETSLVLDQGEAPVVQRGRVGFHVPHQAAGHRFAVRAGRIEVRVVGTRFEITRAHDVVTVAVSEGMVEVWTPIDADPRLAARLHAGERWSEAANDPKSAAGRSTQTAMIEGAHVGGGNPTSAAAGGNEARSTSRRAFDSAPPSHSRPHAARVVALADPMDRSLAPARAVRATDPAGALALYRRLADGRGPTAENALYELGEIYCDRLGQPQQGLATWREYRQRFPRGLLQAEVDVSVIETLAMVGSRSEALGEASTFLQHHPDSERRHEVARVAGNLARAGGNCRAAVSFYERAIDGSGTSRDADDAAFARAACLNELSDPRTESAASAYLARFPEGRHVSAVRAVIEDARGRR